MKRAKESMHYYPSQTDLAWLEAEAIFIIRQALHVDPNPVLLFSGGKDSATLLHLIQKATFPMRANVRLLHVDTGFNFPEVESFLAPLQSTTTFFRAKVKDLVPEARDIIQVNPFQSKALLRWIQMQTPKVIFGGGRRDEDRARAKERIFSLRKNSGGWDPANQRMEIENIFCDALLQDQHWRVFPLSNWTEIDVWAYIEQENIALPSLYFSHKRNCIKSGAGTLVAYDPAIWPSANFAEYQVRARTVGDLVSTGFKESSASTIKDVVTELLSETSSERSGREDDRQQAFSMERRKREGYF
jgi:sulfate adenylyltransferase subunit 2